MTHLKHLCLMPLLLVLALAGTPALADDEAAWAPTPPRLSFIDGEVSYWRPGADDWAQARVNLALAAGDALYSGTDANFEVQFGSRSFARADENSQLSLVEQDEHRIQFKLTSGRASFDMRSVAAGDRVEVSTPNAVFVIEHPGYYRVEVGSDDTHFVTRRGGEATVTTADGRAMGIYPSEEVVVSAGTPVAVATYAAAEPDAWDLWNDERSDRIGESISARYLPPDVYGTEELDHYGHWRVVPSYGSVWIPYGVSADWVPYSAGAWVWDPYYEWTWVDDAPWGWAPFHYGRWVYIGGFWAWAPGPVVRRPVYCPALVAFMVRGHDVSARIGLPGLWWVALGWGEPVLPWWGHRQYRGHPHWAGWGGPRIVNNVVVRQTTVIQAGDIHFHNASVPHAILTVPADTFGRGRIHATRENRYRATEFTPVRGELPVKPTRASLSGGAPRVAPPPRDIVSRPVVSTRVPRVPVPALPGEAPRVRSQAVPESRYVIPPAHRVDDVRSLPRPPRGAEAGPEPAPLPLPPRYGEVKKALPPPVIPRHPGAVQEREVVRERGTVRSQATPHALPSERRAAQPPAVSVPQAAAGHPPAPGPGAQVPRVGGDVAPGSVQTPRGHVAPVPRVHPSAPAIVMPPASAPRPAATGGAAGPRETVPGSTHPPRVRSESTAPRGDVRHDRVERPLPGQPANQTFRGRDRENRDAR